VEAGKQINIIYLCNSRTNYSHWK